ncbi:hypothetical protein ACXPWS_16765 [Mycobacterium sp. BMJ-28]
MARRTDATRRSVPLAVCAVLAVSGCGASNVVNTGEPHTPVTTSPAQPSLPAYATNAHLANANEFYATSGVQQGYFFVTPSGRWRCAIIPHVQAGCRAAGSTTLPIAGAPTAVPGADGSQVPPSALVIDRNDDAQFVAAEDDPFSLQPGPAATLPFGTVLAAAGFRCNVQEASGVSCGSEASGKGFTFSADGYSLAYTDVPQM